MIGIGIIGLGRIGSGRHIPDISTSCRDGKIVAVCDTDKAALERVGEWQQIDAAHRFERYEDLIACPEVDAVEVCTPNYLHCEMAAAAALAGKPVNVEKPLAARLDQALELQKVLAKTGTPGMMCFSYRFMSAVRYAKEILDEGMLGQIINVNVAYLQSGAFIPGRRLEWRFDKEKTGTGALGDLGAHLIDMAMLLIGDIKEVSATMGTVVKRRKRLDSEEYADVLVDDYCNFTAEFEGGASGLFTVTRCAVGHGNTIRFEIFGREGVLSFDLNHPDTLDVCLGKLDAEGNGMHTLKVPQRFKASQEQTFIDMALGRETKYLPTIADGIKCQRVLEAIEKSARSRSFVRV